MAKPDWRFGQVLVGYGGQKVMFVKWDMERQRMLGGGMPQFVGMRLNHKDSLPKEFFKPGDMGNYSVGSWKAVDE